MIDISKYEHDCGMILSWQMILFTDDYPARLWWPPPWPRCSRRASVQSPTRRPSGETACDGRSWATATHTFSARPCRLACPQRCAQSSAGTTDPAPDPYATYQWGTWQNLPEQPPASDHFRTLHLPRKSGVRPRQNIFTHISDNKTVLRQQNECCTWLIDWVQWYLILSQRRIAS